MSKDFLDPYKDLDQNKKCRLQTWIGIDDHDFVMSVRPGKGTIQVVNNTLWERFVRAIQKAGVKDLSDKAKFEEFVQKFEIVLKKKGTK